MVQLSQYDRNPFDGKDADRQQIWEMLVRRDIDAFIAADWDMVAEDFVEGEFFGIDAGKTPSPDRWQPSFSTLSAYRKEWLSQAADTRKVTDSERLRAAIFTLTDLKQIDIDGDFAVAHKKFNGNVPLKSGGSDRLEWQTLYFCKRVDGKWKIRGFIGYMPYDLGSTAEKGAKRVPQTQQHVTAGPYSPVVEVAAGSRLIVISGQAPLDLEGNIVGDDIETQTRVTLENCRKQLQAAGADLQDVFKANVYLTDLSLWPRFNNVYREIMPQPFPARAAVGTSLLGFLVEIEMWAAVP